MDLFSVGRIRSMHPIQREIAFIDRRVDDFAALLASLRCSSTMASRIVFSLQLQASSSVASRPLVSTDDRTGY
jgi:hypothetical protein